MKYFNDKSSVAPLTINNTFTSKSRVYCCSVKGWHIRLHKRVGEDIIKITVPAHKAIKRSTLSHIIKYAGLTLEEFIKLL